MFSARRPSAGPLPSRPADPLGGWRWYATAGCPSQTWRSGSRTTSPCNCGVRRTWHDSRLLGSRGAALLEPYIGRDGKAGTLNIAPETLAARVKDLDANNVQVHVHAIGDRATDCC